jgi:peptide/nickel transport system ATP-binding protein
MSGQSLVSVRDLRVRFHSRTGVVEAVRGISFDIERGETLAIVGESGSGKSVTARTLVGLAGPNSAVTASEFRLDGRDARDFGERDWRSVRGRLAGLVLQDALVSLDPLRTVGREIGEVLATHDVGTRADRPGRVERLLDSVGVPEPDVRARQYPHELSGGLRQRALIASALAGGPELVIADEPTTALDVTVQAQILAMLAERKAAGETLLLISHDLAVVSSIADRVLVMRDGVVVEAGPTNDLLTAPEHPYTRRLLAAVPSVRTRGMRLSDLDPRPAPPRAIDHGRAVLEADGLSKAYRKPGGGLRQAVDGVSFRIASGETLGIVGESGSGKTTVARLLLGLAKPDAGSVRLDGEAWTGVPERLRRHRRRAVQAISQDPLGSFDPRHTVERLIGDGVTAAGVRRRERRSRVAELLEQVGLTADLLPRRPWELSGGQRQRVAIARALAPRPELIICDEPVSALDVSIQAQVLDLLLDLRAGLGTSLLFISHDLGVVHHVSDRVLVMRDGRLVEEGQVDDVLFTPRHDYTKALVAAVPTIGAPWPSLPNIA